MSDTIQVETIPASKRVGHNLTEDQLIAIKTYLELGYTGAQASRLTGVPADSIYKMIKGEWGHLAKVPTNNELKKYWNERRKSFIDSAYDKVEMMMDAITAEKITPNALTDLVKSIDMLMGRAMQSVGTTSSTHEVEEELSIVKNMDDAGLDKFIGNAVKTLGEDSGITLRRKVRRTIKTVDEHGSERAAQLPRTSSQDSQNLDLDIGEADIGEAGGAGRAVNAGVNGSTRVVDTGAVDAGVVDTGAVRAGAVDAGVVDAEFSNATAANAITSVIEAYDEESAAGVANEASNEVANEASNGVANEDVTDAPIGDNFIDPREKFRQAVDKQAGRHPLDEPKSNEGDDGQGPDPTLEE